MKIFYGEMFRCINCHFLDAWCALTLPNQKRDRRNTLVECYARW
jgi:hypothetical protein